MKNLLLIISLATIPSLAHGQGTIAFGNSALTRCIICPNPTGSPPRNATAADGLIIGAFYGPAAAPPMLFVRHRALPPLGQRPVL